MPQNSTNIQYLEYKTYSVHFPKKETNKSQSTEFLISLLYQSSVTSYIKYFTRILRNKTPINGIRKYVYLYMYKICMAT